MASGSCACGTRRSKVGFSLQVCDAKHSHEEKGKDGQEDLVFPFPIHGRRLLYPSLAWGSGASRSQLCILCWRCQALNPALILAWMGWVPAEPSPAVAVPRALLGLLQNSLQNPVLREEDLLSLPCSWATLLRCPRSPEGIRGSRRMKFNTWGRSSSSGHGRGGCIPAGARPELLKEYLAAFPQ